MQDVANDRPGRRGHHPDHPGQKRQRLFALGGEQPLGGESLAPLFEQLEQRADPGQLDRVDDELIFRAPRKGSQPPGAHHLHPVLGLDRDPDRGGSPTHCVEHRVGVLEREIAMARAVAFEAGNLAAHPDIAEPILDRALECQRQLRDGIFGQVRAGRGCDQQIIHPHMIAERRLKREGEGFAVW